ncbi:MAG: type II secretion system F family protein [Candidatus Omnitrophica bacterium]|nr:type II secretion system F family protein [Candidatus Omnitrophota bacterium]
MSRRAMPTFAYVVKDTAGHKHNGLLEAASRQALMEQLWKQDFVVLAIQEQERRAGLSRLGQPKVPVQQLVIFSRQLATMVSTGIPIIGALDVLASQAEHRTLRQVIRRIGTDVEGGMSLSECLAKYPRIFSEFVVSMVKAGESSGRLDEILDRVASYLEKTDALRRKVQSSLFYPMVVSCLAGAITTFLVIVIVPKFKDIFTSLGGRLPLPTLILMSVSEFLGRYLLVEGFLLVAGLIGCRLYLNTKAGRWWFDHWKLRMPILGTLFRKVAIARFARTLSTLVRSGVPILTALEIVAKTAGNKIVEQAVLDARTSIREGEPIADPLTKSKVFPPMVTRMVSIGEKTGQLEQMLSKVADFYESEVDTAVTGLTSLIEPLIITALGLVIGAIVIALFLPIFNVSQLINPY